MKKPKRRVCSKRLFEEGTSDMCELDGGRQPNDVSIFSIFLDYLNFLVIVFCFLNIVLYSFLAKPRTDVVDSSIPRQLTGEGR